MCGVGQKDSWRERKAEVSIMTEDAESVYKRDFSFLGICQCQV